MPNPLSTRSAADQEIDRHAADAQVSGSAIDSRIEYPCYKSFDPFIDVARLQALDGFLTAQIRNHMQSEDDYRFYTGPYRLDPNTAGRAGARMIYLAQSEMPDSYFDLDKSELWTRTDAADEFQPLVDFISTLPFERTGRMLIFYDDVARAGPAHRDHIEDDVCHEFVWFRTNLRKRFYMLDPRTGSREYVESYSAWFDTVNQFHGSDPCEGLSFSVRVDGVFTSEFRRRIPVPTVNRASTPALWSALGDQS